MYRIGILGSDNSHADRFSEILNRSDHPAYLPNSGAKVVAIWGQEAERTQQVATNGRIDTIVAAPEEMIGQVDEERLKGILIALRTIRQNAVQKV